MGTSDISHMRVRIVQKKENELDQRVNKAKRVIAQYVKQNMLSDKEKPSII